MLFSQKDVSKVSALAHPDSHRGEAEDQITTVQLAAAIGAPSVVHQQGRSSVTMVQAKTGGPGGWKKHIGIER